MAISASTASEPKATKRARLKAFLESRGAEVLVIYLPHGESGLKVGVDDFLAAGSPEPLEVEWSPSDLYILYTGGTTGLPKGVLWQQHDIFLAAMGGRPYGSDTAFDQIIEQIDRRLLTLPGDTIVLPGHGNDTTIATERPHLDEWIERRW